MTNRKIEMRTMLEHARLLLATLLVIGATPAAGAQPSITIGNGSAEPANSSISTGAVGPIDAFSVQTSSGTATITAVVMNLTAGNAALSDLSVNSNSTCTGTTYGSLGAAPASGNNTITLTTSISATTSSSATNLYVCGTAATVASSTTVTGNLSAVTASGYTSSDSDTTNATLTVTPPASITIGNGSAEPANSSITLGALGPIDAFSVQTSSSTATITAVTVSLTAGASALSNLFINSTAACTGTTYGTLSSGLVVGNNTVGLTTNLSATTSSSATNLYVCGTAASVASSTTVTGTVASVTATGYTSTDNDTTNATLTVTPPSITVGNGSAEPANSSISSGAVGPIDAFSVQTSSGNATINAVTVSLTAGNTALSDLSVNANATCTGTTYGSLGAAPASGNNTITLTTSISATTSSSATNLYVCGTAATVASSTTVTGNLSAVTASGYSSTDSDTTNATLTVTPPASIVITIGNGSAEPSNSSISSGAVGPIDAFSVQTSSGTATITAVTVSLTAGASALSNLFINSTAACTGTTYGTLSSGLVVGNNTVGLSTNISATTSSSATNLYVCGTAATVASSTTVTGNLSAVTASGYTSTDNDTTNATLTVTPPASIVITIGNGSAEPSNSSITLGALGPIDAFSVQTSSGTATITAVTVSLTAGASALSNLFINSAAACTGTTYGTLSSGLVVGNNTVGLTTNISATTSSSATNLYVCATAASVASSTTVTGTVASATATGYTSTDNDTTNATLTVTPPPSITIGNGSAEPANSSISTGAVGPIDAFSVQTSAGTATVTAVTVSLTAGASALSTLFINSTAACTGTTYGTLSSGLVVGNNTVGLSTNISATTSSSATTLYVCGTAASVASSTTVTGTVASVTATGYTFTDNDTTSATLTVMPGNLVLTNPGSQPAAGTLAAGATSWTYVGQLTLAATSGTITLGSIAIANGAVAPQATRSDLQLNLVSSAGTAVYSTGGWNGTNWVFGTIVDPTTGLPVAITTTAVTFRVYATANYGAAASENFTMKVDPANIIALAPALATTGTVFNGNTFVTAAPATVDEGSKTDTASPMVSIVNPEKGKAVSGTFLVQIYVFSTNGTAIAAMGLTTNGSTPSCVANDGTITKDSHAYASTSAAMYSKTLSGLAAGTYTLKACAKNGTGTAIVSAPVTITVRTAGTGDGSLLLRDNSSQLCSDCHDQNKILTHSSQSAGSKYGSWSVNCRDCHTPHSTRNLYLVKEQIVPPAVNGYQSTKDVRIAKTTGDSNVSGTGTPSSSSFVNTDNSGPCQVCHTRTASGTGTARWRNTGNADSHYTYAAGTQACKNCHSHAKGFAAGESTGGAPCGGCHAPIFGPMNGTTTTTPSGATILTRHTLGSAASNVAPTDSGISWASPLNANAAVARSCVNMCHGDHPHNVGAGTTHDYNAYLSAASSASRGNGLPTASNRDNTDYDPAQANGGMCLSCHTNPVDAGSPVQHPAVDKTAYDASAHDFTTNSYGTWTYTLDYGTFARNCTKCHADRDGRPNDGSSPFASVHYSQYPSLLSGNLNPAKTGNVAADYVCWNCHGNGTTGTNYSGKDLASMAGRASGHVATSQTYNVTNDSVHDTIAEGAGTGTLFSGSNRHVNCVDCHNPHQSGKAYDSGTATSATVSTLSDSSKSGKWVASQWVNYSVLISSGTGAGQAPLVTASDTSGNVTVASWPGGTPASGSGYNLVLRSNKASAAAKGVKGLAVSGATAYSVGSATFVDGSTTVYGGAGGGYVTAATATSVTCATKNWGTNLFAGYTLRVVSGTGAGQTATVGSNTINVLTLSTSLATVPTAGSIVVLYKSGSTDTPVWTSSIVGGYIRNELDRSNRWYRIAAITAAAPYYTATITPAYTSYNGGAAGGLSNTKMSSNTGAQYYMDHGTSYVISTATFTPVASATYEYEICLKCHSSWAWGDSPPNVPSGQVDGSTVTQSNIVYDFGSGQLGYHPIFTMGKNQPTAVTNAAWNLNAAYTRVDNTGSSSTFGLSNTFTAGWFKESLLQCSDCHASDTSSDPLGPHGSGKKWILRGLDTTVSWVRRTSAGTAWETITNASVPSTPTTEAKNFCLNCHRWDVYGYIGWSGTSGANLGRVPHDPTGNSSTYNAGKLPVSGIVCQNCHGGDRVGGIHGSSRGKFTFSYDPSTSAVKAITNQTGSFSGKRLLNGAYWYGVTRATTGTGVTCWGKSGTDTVSACAHTHTGDNGGVVAKYSYDDAADL